jgi:hypothetical protein
MASAAKAAGSPPQIQTVFYSRHTQNPKLGFNAGADASWMWAQYVGIGVLVRYSWGDIRFTGIKPQETKVTAGGLTLAFGLRFRN